MMDYEELVDRLGNLSRFLTGQDQTDVRAAADAIEELKYALLLMVLQYCTTDDGLLFHSFMTAGECAFAVLGLENGQHEAPLWEKIDREMQEASERAAAKTAPKED